MHGFTRFTCGTLCLLLALPAHALTAARIVVDGNPGADRTTYMASVNDTDRPIQHYGTEYRNMLPQADLPIGHIPPHYTLPNGADTPYNAEHVGYKGLGLGFDQAFPSGVSGGYRYRLSCSRVGFANICHIAPGSLAVTHYRTTCNGRPLSFRVSAGYGMERGEIIREAVGAVAAQTVPTTTAATIGQAMAQADAQYITGKYGLNFTTWDLWQEVQAGRIRPPGQFMSEVLPRVGAASAFGALLLFTASYELASRFAPYGAIDAEMSYIHFDAEGDSQVTQTLEDSALGQEIVIDDCLRIHARVQDAPYLSEASTSLVPDRDDALVTTVFSRVVPAVSAAQSCDLRVSDDEKHFSGMCQNLQHQMVATQLDASSCVNAADIANADGVLQCQGEKIPRPAGSYLRACRQVAWNGSELRASCGAFDALAFPRLDYAGACRAGSTVSYDPGARQLRCDTSRAAS